MMTLRYALKRGFWVTNRNWQLVVIKLIFLFLGLIGFGVVVVFPIGVVFMMFGYDISNIVRGLDFSDCSSHMLSKYLSLGIALMGIVFGYIFLFFVADIYVFGASCGMLARGIKGSDFTFTMGDFFLEGRRLFFPFLGFLSMVGFIIIAEVFFLLVYFLTASMIVDAAQGVATLGIFVEILIRLVTYVLVFFFIFGTFSVTTCGLGILCLKGSGVIESLKEAFSFVTEKPYAFWLYCLLAAGYLFVHLFMLITGFSFTMMDDTGILLLIPYQILIYATQTYLGLLILSSIFSYYSESIGLIDGMSSLQDDISLQAPRSSVSQTQTDIHE